jgi:hypothetical protein
MIHAADLYDFLKHAKPHRGISRRYRKYVFPVGPLTWIYGERARKAKINMTFQIYEDEDLEWVGVRTWLRQAG